MSVNIIIIYHYIRGPASHLSNVSQPNVCLNNSISICCFYYQLNLSSVCVDLYVWYLDTPV